MTVLRRTSGISSFRPLDPDRILDMVGMLSELGTKSVKLAWSVPCGLMSLSRSASGWKKEKKKLVKAVY